MASVIDVADRSVVARSSKCSRSASSAATIQSARDVPGGRHPLGHGRHPTFEVGGRTALLGEHRRRQDDIGPLGRGREERIEGDDDAGPIEGLGGQRRHPGSQPAGRHRGGRGGRSRQRQRPPGCRPRRGHPGAGAARVAAHPRRSPAAMPGARRGRVVRRRRRRTRRGAWRRPTPSTRRGSLARRR